MRVAVVSDTHDNLSAVDDLVREIESRNIKTVFHLGDIISPFTLKKFSAFEVYAVFGNNDGERYALRRIAASSGMVIEEPPHIMKISGKNVLLYHGVGSAEKTVRIAESFAASSRYDAVFYGHTHVMDARYVGKTLLLNPGAASGYLAGKRTFAIVDLSTLEWEFVEF